MSVVCNVRNLGTSFDNHLSMKTPLSTRLVNQDFTICIILGALNDILALKIESIVQAIVISRIDYCNRPLYGVVATNLSKLQRVQNAAVLLVFSLPRHEHITSSFIRLHWLPIKFRINFKIAMLCFKCIHGPSIKKAWSPARRLRHTTSARAPVCSWKTIHADRKNCLAMEPFPMHPPRFGTFSRNH